MQASDDRSAILDKKDEDFGKLENHEDRASMRTLELLSLVLEDTWTTISSHISNTDLQALLEMCMIFHCISWFFMVFSGNA